MDQLRETPAVSLTLPHEMIRLMLGLNNYGEDLIKLISDAGNLKWASKGKRVSFRVAEEVKVADWREYPVVEVYQNEEVANVIDDTLESVLIAVKLRTDVAHWIKRRSSPLHLMFNVVLRPSEHKRPPNAGLTIVGSLVGGASFDDGVLTELSASAEETLAA